MTEPQRALAEHAIGVLQAWICGYTDPDASGHQAYVSVVEYGSDWVDARISAPDARYGLHPSYRVSVTVRPTSSEVCASDDDESSDRGSLSSRDEPGAVRPVSGSGHRT